MIKLRVSWDTPDEKEKATNVFSSAISIVEGKAEILGVHRDSEHHTQTELELRLKPNR